MTYLLNNIALANSYIRMSKSCIE